MSNCEFKKFILTSFVALGMRSKGNARKKLWKKNSWLLHLDNFPVHRSVYWKNVEMEKPAVLYSSEMK